MKKHRKVIWYTCIAIGMSLVALGIIAIGAKIVENLHLFFKP